MHKLTISGILFGGHLLSHLLHLLGLASLDLGKFLLREVEVAVLLHPRLPLLPEVRQKKTLSVTIHVSGNTLESRCRLGA